MNEVARLDGGREIDEAAIRFADGRVVLAEDPLADSSQPSGRDEATRRLISRLPFSRFGINPMERFQDQKNGRRR